MSQAISAILWSLGGFLLGYCLGRIKSEVDEVREVVVDGATHKTPGRLPNAQVILGVVIVLLTLGTSIQLYRQSSELDDSIECNRATFQDLKDSLGGSVESGFAQREAWRTLILEADPTRPATPEERRRNIDILSTSFAEADRSGNALLAQIERSNHCD